MATEDDIKDNILALAESIKADDKETALQTAIELMTVLLVDLHRIADAMEHIARRAK